MSDRLKFFRRLMSAFEGTSNPQRAVERGFYVNLPNNPIEEITGRVTLRPSSVHLLFGGIGSGKTTQLLLTQQALNELEDIKAIYVDVSLVTDISDLQSGALIAIAGLELIKTLGNTNNTQINKHKQTIERAAYGYSEKKIVTKSVFPIYEEVAKLQEVFKSITNYEKEEAIIHKGLLSSEKQENRELVLDAFSQLNKAAKEITKKYTVFLFDSLDRLRNSKIINSALDDVIDINNIGTGSVLIGSIATMYEEREHIAEISDYNYFLPYCNVSENDEARQFFKDILTIRDPENCITLDARELLILHSGGVLRDLMSLCQASIEEAYMDGSDLITANHANQAILALARSKLIGLTDSSIEILSKVMTENSFSPRTSEDFDLLLTGHILEYRYPRRRFVVHPILVPILEKIVVGVVNG
jgi:hypothetical protein